MIQGLCYRQAESSIDIKLDNPDADSYRFQSIAELLAHWKKINKDKHGKHCHDQGKHFSPFVLSVIGILGRDPSFVSL